MNLEIKKLNPSLGDDYIFYFDNVAFRDNPQCSLCYCLEGHDNSVDEVIDLTKKDIQREKAKLRTILEKTQMEFIIFMVH